MREELEKTYDLCMKLLHEARSLADEGDSIQASEKLYKVAEEVVKVLS